MKLLIICFLLFSLSLFSIDLHLPASAIQNAASGSILIYPSPSAADSNPACSCKGVETSATYLFSMEDLPYFNFHFQQKYKHIGIHLGSSYLAHPLYQESINTLSLNYSYSYFTIGSSLRYLYNSVEDYNKGQSISADIGILWQNENILSSLSILNVTQSKLLQVKLPVVYLLESCYKITDKSRISVGLEKETDFEFSFKIAGRYDIYKALTILSSYQFQPDRIGIGMVFNLNSFSICYSVRTHQYLSLSHYISIGYAF